MDFFYSLLKVTSMAATGVFGALGLLTKYKTDQGQITKWGKVALGGILVSSGISLGLYLLEISKAKAAAATAQAEAQATAEKLQTILVNARKTASQQAESLEETNKLKLGLDKTLSKTDVIAKGMGDSLIAQQSVLKGNEKILGGITNSLTQQSELLRLNAGTLNEVSRGVYEIKDVKVGFWIYVPTDHPQLKPFIDRFDKELSSIGPISFDRGLPWINGSTSEQFAFGPNAPLAPNNMTEKLAATLLEYSKVELQFFKEPIAPGDHRSINGKWDRNIGPDLTMGVDGEFSKKGHTVLYNVSSKRFTLMAVSLSSDPQDWHGTGKIVGLPDLLGSQMFVILPSISGSGDGAIDQYVREIRKNFELQTLVLSLSGGRQFWFSKGTLQKHVSASGVPIYSFVFPKSMDELRKLQPY